MIYDTRTNTLHSLPCVIRGIAVSTFESAGNSFLQKYDLRWATKEEIDHYTNLRQEKLVSSETARLDIIRQDVMKFLTTWSELKIASVPTGFNNAIDLAETEFNRLESVVADPADTSVTLNDLVTFQKHTQKLIALRISFDKPSEEEGNVRPPIEWVDVLKIAAGQ